MNRFDRDYAVIGANSRIWAETNDASRAEQYARELIEQGISCRVVKSDLPAMIAAYQALKEYKR